MIEFIVGVAVVLFAGYFIARYRDRVRDLANATMLGISAGAAVPDLSVSHDDGAGRTPDSHPTGPHWDGADSTHHTDSI